MENTNIKIKTCKLCGSSENKFEPHRHKCTKCLSKIKNEKLKEKNYFKNYYNEHRDVFLERACKDYYKPKTKILV
jgi:hypothetical protein